MSTATKRIPLIDLKVEETTAVRCLGSLEVRSAAMQCALPLGSVDIQASVADRVASVTIKQTFKNTYAEHLEAVYIFPLPGGCVVSDFEMRVGTRVVKGIVQERQQARAEYQQAIEQGKRAALLEQERDDVFTVQVGNVPPNEEITVVLTYSERLPFFENGKTELRLPLVVSPRYIPGDSVNRSQVGAGTECDTTIVPDASRISPPRLAPGLDPKVSLAISAKLLMSDHSGPGTVSELTCSQHATQLSLDDGCVQVELARTDERLNCDFVLQWRLATGAVRSSMLVYRDKDGQSYGMLSLIPPSKDGYVSAARDVLFVLDRSGSMGGEKMVSAAQSCSILLSTLGPSDRFAIQAFDTVGEWLTVPRVSGRAAHWIQADEAGVTKGEKFLRGIEARGGTEMDNAIREAFATVASRPDADGRIPVVVVLTDGEVGDESRIYRRVQQDLADARLFAVGIDTSVNSGLLRRLANLGGGTATFVQPGASLENALRSVGREIGSPLITDIEIISDGSAIEDYSIAPSRIPDLFEGRAVTVFFKLSGKGSVKIRGKWTDGRPFEEKVKTRMAPVAAVSQLWAKAMIGDLEDSFRLRADDRTRQRIIGLAVKHSLLTKFTAFVAVDHAEIANNGQDLRQIVQPVESPAGWAERFGSNPSAGQQNNHVCSGSTCLFCRAINEPQARGRTSSGGALLGRIGMISGLPEPIDGSSSWGGSAPNMPGAAQESSFGASTGSFASVPLSDEECDRIFSDSGTKNIGSASPQSPNIQKAQQESDSQAQPKSKKERADAPAELKRSSGPDAAAASPSMMPPPRTPGSPPPAPKASAPVPQQPSSGIMGKLNQLFGRSDEKIGAVPARKGAEPLVKHAARKQLEKFAEALRKAMDEVQAGRVPDCTELEKLRKELLATLSQADCGTQVPQLQKFLRGAAVELIHSSKQNAVTAAGISPLWERHMTAFHGALAEATTQLSTTGTSGDDRFWESSV